MASNTRIASLADKTAYVRAMNADGVTVIEGTASWCPQCKTIAPEVEKMAVEFEGRARFYTFDVDTNPDVAQELGVNVMPTFSIFKDGDICEGVTGPKIKELRNAIEKNFG